jgi:hypothetical protein
MDEIPREVRLRPEYAELYAEIPPGLWLPARQATELIVRRASAARHLSIHQRTLDPKHFEFRGGLPEHRREGARTRGTDQPGSKR